MASAHPDASPLGGGRRSGSEGRPAAEGKMKNNDGRLKGGEWDTQAKTSFSDKSVGVQPNEGAPHLPSPSVDGTKV